MTGMFAAAAAPLAKAAMPVGQHAPATPSLFGAVFAETPPPGPLPSVTSFRELPPEGDALRLQQSRNFMANTLNAFVGSIGASSLLNRIEDAKGHGDLRQLFDEWYHAIVMSREGRREAESLRAKLLQVI